MHYVRNGKIRGFVFVDLLRWSCVIGHFMGKRLDFVTFVKFGLQNRLDLDV